MVDDVAIDRAPPTETLLGYVLQASHYLSTGEAFSDENQCRLQNHHRQPGVGALQLREPAVCARQAGRYRP